MRFPVRSCVVLALVAGAATCTEAPSLGPTASRAAAKARLSLNPVFSPSAAAVFSQRSQFAGIGFDHVRIVIVRPPSEVVKDTTIVFNPDSPPVTLDLNVDARTTGESFTVTLDYTSGDAVVFHGEGPVVSHAPDAPSPTGQDIVVQYVGVGASATKLVVAPKTVTIVSPGTATFTANAFDAANAAVAGAPVSWSSSDPTIASINVSTGVLTTTGKRGTSVVTASIPTKLGIISDNATVTVSLPVASIALISGGGQTGKVGSTLAQAGVVRATASDGVGVAGVSVVFAAPAGGKVGSASVTTDASGQASTSLTLGGAVGPQSFAAVAGAFSVSISAVATPGDPASISAVSGGGQQDTVKKALKLPFVVKVTDAFGNALSGVAVSWSRSAGSGTLGAATTTTGSDGQTSVGYTLGATVGAEAITASVAGVASGVSFSATALPAGPANIAAVSGGGQVGRVLTSLAAPFVVKVTDDAGNPVNGAVVSWSATNGTIAPTSTTDATGQTGATLSLGSVAGSAGATASISGKSVGFSATAAPGLVAKLNFRATPASSVAGAVIVPTIQVELLDAAGNLTAAANTVTLAIGTNPGSATLGGTLTRTSAAGVAVFDNISLSAAGSGYTLVATSAGATPATSAGFNVTVAGGPGPGAAAKLAITRQPSATTVSGVPFVTQPIIQVQDAAGNPVGAPPGLSVAAVWSTGSERNNLASASSTTGGASFTSFYVIGAGTGTVVFSAPGLTSVASIPITSTLPAAVATALQFVATPASTIAGSTISPAVQIKIVDAGGAVVTTATNNVTLAIGTNPASGTLAGTLTVAAVSGVATFSTLSINNAGTGYTLTASASGLTGSTSAAFDITTAPSVTSTWTGAVSNVWGVVGNWSTVVPGPTVDAVIPSGTPNPPLIGSASSAKSVTIQALADLFIASSTLTVGSGGIVNQGTLNLLNGTVVGALNNQGQVLENGSSAITGVITTSPSSFIRLQGINTFGAATLTVSTGFTNTGTIELTDAIAGYGATFAVTSGSLINAPGGVISVLTGANGPRILAAQLDNQSTITIADAQGLTISKAGAAHTNSGTIALTTGNITLSQTGTTPSFTNASTGAVTIASGHTFTITGGTLDLSVGSVSGPGVLDVNSLTLAFSTATMTAPLNLSATTIAGGAVTIPSGQTLNLVGGTLAAAVVNQGLLLVNGTSAVSGALTTAAGSIIRVQGMPSYGAATFTVASGFTNNATIELTDVTAGYGATLAVTSGSLVNAPGAVFSVLAGANGPRTLAAQLDNQSTITIADAQGLTINKPSAAHTNSGTIALTTGNIAVTQTGTTPSFTNTSTGVITIAAGRTFTVTGGALDLSVGSLSGPGVLDVNSLTLALTTATMTAPINLSATTVAGGTVTIPSGQTLNIVGGTFGAAIINQGLLLINGNSGLSGALTTGSGSILRVQGINTYGAATFTVASGFTNTATIELTDAVAGYGATLAVTAGTFTNAPAGTFSVLTGANGPRTLAAQLDNQGTITIADPQGLAINKASAAHANSGTIAMTAGNITLTQSGTTPSFTNAGTGVITIASGRTFTVTGGTLDLSVGSLSGPGVLDVNSLALAFTTATMTAPISLSSTTITGGTVTIPSGQTLNVVSGTLAAAVINQGLFLVNGNSGMSGALTTGGGSTLRVQGMPTYGAATFTVASGFTNTATIELTDVVAGYGATLAVTAGSLTNAPGGTFSVLTGAGGPRTLAAQLNNQGAITIADPQGLAISKASAVHTNSGTIALTAGNITLTQSGTTPSFTNTSAGVITIAAGRTLTVTGGTLDLSVGSLSGPGLLDVNSLTLAFTTATMTAPINLTTTTIAGGAVTIPSGQTLNFVGGTLAASVNNQGLFLVNGTSTLAGALTTGPGSTLRVQGINTYGGANFTVGSGFTNTATIELTDAVAGYGATLGVTSGSLVNAPGAVFSVLTGAGGPRTLAAQLDNQSTITIADPQGLTISKAGAAHTNSGTIALTTGNITLTQTGTTPSFTNGASGTVTIAAGRTWTVTGGTLDLSAGSVTGPGVLDVNSLTLAFTTATMTAPINLTSTTIAGGAVMIPSGQTLNLVGGTLAATVNNQGLFLVNGTSALSGALTTGSGSTLRVQGINTYGGANFTVATGFTNTATIELTDAVAGYGATLGVTSGSLTNAPGAAFSILTGAGGPRTLAAQLNNQGTITIADPQGLTISKAGAAHTNSGTIALTTGNITLTQSGTTPSFTNTSTGVITIASTHTLTATGGTLDLSLGSLSGPGVLDVNSLTLAFTTATMTAPINLTSTTIAGGTVTIPSGQTLNLVGGTLAAAVNNNGLFLVNGTSALSGALTTGSGSTLQVQGINTYGGANFTVASGFTNTATIELTDAVAGYGATLGVTSGSLVNAPGAVFSVLTGAGGPRTLAAQLDNRSTITIADPQGLTISKASAAHANSGVIALTSGNITLTQTGTTPSFTNGAAGSVTIAATHTWTVTGGTLDLSAGLVSGAGVLDVNSLTLAFTTATMTAPINLTTTTIAGGAVTIPSGQTLNLVGGTLAASVNNQGLFLVNGTSALSGALTTGVGSTLRVQGINTYGGANFTVASGFTNTATIELTDAVAGYGATLGVTSGTLTNAPGATFSVLTGATGPRTLAAQLDNQSTITIADPQGLLISKSGVAHSNSGTIAMTSGNLTVTLPGSLTNTGLLSIGSGRTLTVNGGGTFTNAAAPSVGQILGPGTLDVTGTTFTNNGDYTAASTGTAGSTFLTGNYTQTGASSTMNIKLAGTALGTSYNRIAVSGVATLSGTLNVTLSGGFSGTAGHTFVVLTYSGSPVGDFTSFNLPAGCTPNPGVGQYQVVCP